MYRLGKSTDREEIMIGDFSDYIHMGHLLGGINEKGLIVKGYDS